MPTSVNAKYSSNGVGIGVDQNGFMVGGPLSGALPGQEVARAVGSVSVLPVIAGRSEAGVGNGGSEGDRNGQRRVRKRSYSQTTHTSASGNCMCLCYYC